MKTRIFTLILSCFLFQLGLAQEKPLRILMIGAHPDDCDIKSGGTAALFSQLGHEVKFLSITNGDAGHMEMGGGMLAVRRNAETQEVARRLGITYEVLDNHDGELMPTLEIRKDVIRKIREWEADVVISHRTNDYHPDHRYTGVLVQDAAFMVGVPNIAADTPPLRKNPVFLYYQDHFEKPNPFSPDIAIDITSVIDQKIYALDAHVSQFYEWLPWISNDPDEIPEGKEERIQWLKSKRALAPNPSVRAALEQWYGSEAADKAQFAEAFEICEYGSQPSESEIKRLFPMLGKSNN
ncbi:PIG-L deacetylase family protein [Algoriphagus hitonicola]|uniref:N-acetylglucosaminyl deacetylase, LmbE family n=1 Tax=Algoriphagus hitonicola TaxID=435880 RepID=A0A1I2NSS4_9BACT|nr:PIG-L family deacetylase [Algoriphagus hitonicola]SFG06922.1 N-acetylglucosaminyl deacetylase, LmbE family [Algoriphagus hitonicola]